jgi:hypothetical protein
MPAGNTYEAIASQTLVSAVNSVSFTSIPSAYTDLVLIVSFTETTTATATNGYITFNSDTYLSQTNYSATMLQGNGSVASSSRYPNDVGVFWNYDTTSGPTIMKFNIMNYVNSTTFKSVLFRQDNVLSGLGSSVKVGLWRNTAAINAINIYGSDQAGAGSADPFAIGSTFSLYGIKAA